MILYLFDALCLPSIVSENRHRATRITLEHSLNYFKTKPYEKHYNIINSIQKNKLTKNPKPCKKKKKKTLQIRPPGQIFISLLAQYTCR